MEFSWEKVLERISEVVTPASFITWFKPTNAKVHEHTITVIAANSFGEDWLRHHYGDLILKTVQDLYGGNYDIVFTSPSSHSDTQSTHFKTNYDFIMEQRKIIDQQQRKIEELENVFKYLNKNYNQVFKKGEFEQTQILLFIYHQIPQFEKDIPF